MNFLTYGDKKNKSLLFLHGMATTAKICYEPILPYLEDYYVILCEIDGHCEDNDGDFISVLNSCEQVEAYVLEHLDGKLYGLIGFSLGATLAVELLGRGKIQVERVLLDAPFVVKMGVLAPVYTKLFMNQIAKLEKGGTIPKVLREFILGRGNNSVIDMLYPKTSRTTLYHGCNQLYNYNIPKELRCYYGQVLLWCGEHEPYPQKGARLLKKYIPQLQTEVFRGMGHGQYLCEFPMVYAKRLLHFLQKKEFM